MSELAELSKLLASRFKGGESHVDIQRNLVSLEIGPDLHQADKIVDTLYAQSGIQAGIMRGGSIRPGSLGLPGNNFVVVSAKQFTPEAIKSLEAMTPAHLSSTPVHEAVPYVPSRSAPARRTTVGVAHR